jgi:integrase
MRNLPIDTLRRIRDTKIKGKTAVYLDAFMLSFYLIGINMADLLALPKDCIVNGRLQYKRAKTGKNYSILVQPEAQAIIDRYPGKTHLLSFREKVSCFRYNCNDLLNKMESGLTWYWARYSWANYAVDLDIPKDIISEALGHKHGSNVTGIYIKYSLNKIDAANRQVIAQNEKLIQMLADKK